MRLLLHLQALSVELALFIFNAPLLLLKTNTKTLTNSCQRLQSLMLSILNVQSLLKHIHKFLHGF